MPGAWSAVQEFDREDVMVEPDGVVQPEACSRLEQPVDGDVGKRAGEIAEHRDGARDDRDCLAWRALRLVHVIAFGSKCSLPAGFDQMRAVWTSTAQRRWASIAVSYSSRSGWWPPAAW